MVVVITYKYDSFYCFLITLSANIVDQYIVTFVTLSIDLLFHRVLPESAEE